MSFHTFSDLSCGQCGIVFGVPHEWLKEKQDTGGTFHCPNGHARVFRESAADTLRRERDRLKQEAARLEEEKREIARERDLALNREKRLKKRAAAGVCPCCNRSFVALQRHMATKHPDFKSAEVVKLKA